MPRQARKKSESGIYHVMLRGINQQQIFEDEEDCEKFIQVLKDCKAISEFKLFAYCLMGNHIHLLIKPEKEDLEQIFKRIGGRYVYWYNVKYQRVGHLFQDRFKSEPVENDSYFLTVLRYINQNPVKAGLCKSAESYKYSSYIDYLSTKKQTLTDIDFALKMISKSQFVKYHEEKSFDKCLDIEEQKQIRLTDEQAQKVIEKYSKCKNATEFQQLDIKSRDIFLKLFKEKGISIRQIGRLTGIPKGIVERALR